MTTPVDKPSALEPSDLDLFIEHASGLWLTREHPAMRYVEVQLSVAEIDGFRDELAALRRRAVDLNACLSALTDHADVMVYNYSKRNPNNRSVYEQLASLVGAARAALRSGGEEKANG